MKKITQNLLVALAFLFSLAIVSQEEDNESLDLQELEEVVLIGGGLLTLLKTEILLLLLLQLKVVKFRKR